MMATAVNRKWASGIGADGQPVFAPRYAIEVNGRKVYNPKDKHYRLAGYQSVVETPPSVPAQEGYHYEPRGWEAQEGAIRRVYVEEASPPPAPRRWSRLDILTALGESDMFDAAFAYLNSIEVKPHISAWLGLNTANYIEEGYPNADAWDAMLNGAAGVLGKTRAEIDAFLDTIPTE